MRTLRPKIAVLSGATVGLVAGAAVFGVVSTGTDRSPKPVAKAASVSLAVAQVKAPVRAPVRAHCAKGARLQHGVCIIHVQRVVHVEHVIHIPPVQPAARQAVDRGGSSSSGANSSQARVQPAGTHSRSTQARVQSTVARRGEPAEVDHEKADKAGEDAKEAAEHSGESDG